MRMTWAQKIKKWRSKYRLTVAQMAHEVGLKPQTLWHLEQGNDEPSEDEEGMISTWHSDKQRIYLLEKRTSGVL